MVVIDEAILVDRTLWRDPLATASRVVVPILAWMLGYAALLLFVVRRQIVPRLPLQEKKRRDPVALAGVENTTVSFINSIVQSCIVVSLWLAHLLGFSGLFCGYVELFVCSFLGYNLYDLIAGLVVADGAVFRREPGLLVHHVIVISSLALSLVEPYAMYYQVIATLCEVNSIFLHGRFIVRQCDPSSSLYVAYERPLNVMQYATYLTWRLGSSLYLAPTGLTHGQLTGNQFWGVLSVGLLTINIVYLYLLVKGDLKQRGWSTYMRKVVE